MPSIEKNSVALVLVFVLLLLLALAASPQAGAPQSGGAAGGAAARRRGVMCGVGSIDKGDKELLAAIMDVTSNGLIGADLSIAEKKRRIRELTAAPPGGKTSEPSPFYREVDKPPAGGASGAKFQAWHAYPTWSKMYKSPSATKQYSKDRMEIMNNLDIDWSLVMKRVTPILEDNREYIGLINKGVDGRLEVVKMVASPSKVGEATSKTALAEVPAELVKEITETPGLFEFHTHPIGYKAWPLPSPTDLFGSLMLGFNGMFAGSIVIGEYGVIITAPSKRLFESVWASRNPSLTMLRRCHDIIQAMSSKRSWSVWTLADYQKMCERFDLNHIVYPTSRYVRDLHTMEFVTSCEQVDDDLLDYIADRIDEELKKEQI